MAWIVIYIIGVVLVGGVSAWYMKNTDEDVTLLDLIKIIFLTLISWLAVLIFTLHIISDFVDGIIIKKGHKEEELW